MVENEKEEPEREDDELAITPVSEETDLEPAEETVENENKEERPRQTFGQIMRRIFIAILRLIIIVAVIAGVGAVIYYGAPFVYQRYIRPVEQNTSQLSSLELRQSQNELELADLQMRLATLEAGQTTDHESLNEINSSLNDINSRVETLEGADSRRNESLVELTYQSDLLRAMELLSRARLFLYQSNFGLARLDVQAARDILTEMQATAPESKQRDISEGLFRLDLVLKNLPAFPVAASDDLDIAWQVLMGGYPALPPTATPTPIPTTPLEETATSIPELTTTPAATP